MTTSTLDFKAPYTIDLMHTQHGWIAKFSNLADRQGVNHWIPTGFTRHALGEHAERAIRSLNPNATLFIIGGK